MGEPFVVTSPVEAPAAASRFRDYIESPVLTNLRVSFDGFDAYDVEPPALPDLFAERPIVLLGKWRGGRVGEIEVLGEGGARRYARRFSVSDSRPLVENAALRYLWARTRISRLSDYGSGPEDAGVVEQIVSLGLSYSLLTKHTSFIAVIEKVRNTDVPARDVDQPLPLPQGVSDLAVGRGYAAGAEPEVWIVLVAASLMLALAALWRRWRTAQNRWDGRAAS